MPDFTTPFSLTVRGGDHFLLREYRSDSQAFSFTTALTAVVFTRRCVSDTSIPVTVSLVAHCDTASDSGSSNGNKSFTIASHRFATLLSDRLIEEEAVMVPLRSPIVFTSRGSVHSLEVKCAEVRPGGSTHSFAANSEVYTVTMHGAQRTTLTKAQVELLCSAGK